MEGTCHNKHVALVDLIRRFPDDEAAKKRLVRCRWPMTFVVHIVTARM